MYALTSILAALRQREMDGHGASIEISMLDCLAEWMTVPIYHTIYGSGPPARTGQRHASIVPYGPFPTRDGLVNLAVQTQAQWERFCAVVLERPDLANYPDYATNALRVINRLSLESLIAAALGELPQKTVEAHLERADVPFGRINDVQGLVDHRQLRERNRWFDVDGEHAPVRALVPPFGIAGMPLRRGSIPSLGQHTANVLEEVHDA
jgi:itaconate CoA-transferase